MNLLDALAYVMSRLAEAQNALQRDSRVFPVNLAIDLSDRKPELSMYLEATLVNGDVLSWNIDVTWSAKECIVAPSIQIIDSPDGGRSVRDFEERTSQTTEDVIESLKQCCDALLSDVDGVVEEFAHWQFFRLARTHGRTWLRWFRKHGKPD